MAVGTSSLLLVSMFIYDEHTFDKYHKNASRIYRIVLDFESDGTVTNWAKTSAPVGYYLNGAYSEIERVVRLRKNPGTDLLTHDDIQFYEEKLFFADSSMFDVFDFKLTRGNPGRVLSEKNSMVISETLARKYFNSDDPIGRSLRLNNQVELKITGIIDEVPANSHFCCRCFYNILHIG
ncbi:MAG TPA: ABC transporter permease [Cyclobacteriaceae bacterium]|nr:ABC transporter permease [Cyclobacteriaceae bacterium]